MLVAVAAPEPASERADGSLHLSQIFVEHGGYVWNSLRRLGVPASDLEDLTHDVFLQVQRHLSDYDRSRPLRPWLFGFAFRLASQHRRRAYRRREVPAAGESERAVDPRARPDERLVIEEDRRLVLEALEAIDLDRRAVFVLYEIDEVPMSDIARALGIPVNTAYSRLRVARGEFAAAVKRLTGAEP
jgi:RNA polymerase sigma-70 factor (ECF subfamily)